MADGDSVLSEAQRVQVSLAREKADRWFAVNGPGGGGYGPDRALANAVRDLLRIVDEFAPPVKR
jgi:hypothetical protein